MVQEIQKGSYPNATQLCKLGPYKVNRRTVLRDIDLLRRCYGVPIKYDSKRKGYYMAGEFSFIPAVGLNTDDYLAIYFFRYCLKGCDGTELGEVMKASYERIFGWLGESQSWKRWASTIAFLDEPEPACFKESWSTLKLLLTAINHHYVVQFDYPSKEGALVRLEVEPIVLATHNGGWKLHAMDRQSGCVQRFAIAGMGKIVLSDLRFDPALLPDPLSVLEQYTIDHRSRKEA